MSSLAELILSATSPASPISTTQLHSIQTASLVFTFKASNQPGSTAAATQDEQSSVGHRKSMGYVEASNGCGGMVMALGGKDGRAAVNVWGFQKEAILQKLIPPVRLATLCVSNTGLYVAGGTSDGRVFFWELATGTLLLTIDAHYRPVSVLEFSHDDSVLVSGGEDAGVSVWSIGSILSATPMNPPAPFATLTDHTLAITAVAIGLGTFPRCRILTASMDSTCKIWDLSTAAPSLLSTFSFPAPVTHVAWDSLERFFFAVCPLSVAVPTLGSAASTPASAGSRVMRVALFSKTKDDFGHDMTEAVGGLGRGEVETVSEGTSYTVPDTITALHLSRHSPTLVLGTSSSTLHILALPSLLPTRLIPPPLSSTPPGPITFVSTLLRPPDLGAGGATGGGVALPQPIVMSGGMGRTVKGTQWGGGGKTGRVATMRVGRAVDVLELIAPARDNSSAAAWGAVPVSTQVDVEAANKAQQLEQEVRDLKAQLAKAVGLNDAMWKKIVEGGGKGAEVEATR
ncbi:pre-rRNA-processing protein IPI3, partial [Phenoliferia sp. Uapishka_3]